MSQEEVKKTEEELCYEEANIDLMVNILENCKMVYKDFARIESAVKEHGYFENEVEFDDVENYVKYTDGWERSRIADALGLKTEEEIYDEVYDEVYNKFHNDKSANTLDGLYRRELVEKLFSMASSELELESFIKPEVLAKLKIMV